MSSVVIRPASPADLAAVQRIVRGAYSPYIARIGREPGPMLDDYAARIANREAWVAERSGSVVGLLVLEAAADYLLLDNVAVDPAAHGGGIGRALIAFAEAEAGRRGLPEIRLYTHERMTENVALYPRLGFKETHRVREKGYDRVYFAKPIGTT